MCNDMEIVKIILFYLRQTDSQTLLRLNQLSKIISVRPQMWLQFCQKEKAVEIQLQLLDQTKKFSLLLSSPENWMNPDSHFLLFLV